MVCMRRSGLFLFALLYSTKLFGIGEQEFFEQPKTAPRFTGPLLTTSSGVVPPGHVNVEPYLYVIKSYGNYTGNWKAVRAPIPVWSMDLRLPIKFGIYDRFGISLNGAISHRYSKDGSATVFGDIPIGIDYQLLKRGPRGIRTPAVKLTVTQIFPTGKYQHLNPDKRNLQVGGSGVFATIFSVTAGQAFIFENDHALSPRASINYTINPVVHVSGSNAYGGAPDTHAKVYRGNTLNAFFGLEYSLTKRWVVAMDLQYRSRRKTTYRGNPGHSPEGERLSLSGPSGEQLSFAPALEYNWSSQMGLIAGTWFTLTGRNSDQFASGVAAFNYYY